MVTVSFFFISATTLSEFVSYSFHQPCPPSLSSCIHLFHPPPSDYLSAAIYLPARPADNSKLTTQPRPPPCLDFTWTKSKDKRFTLRHIPGIWNKHLIFFLSLQFPSTPTFRFLIAYPLAVNKSFSCKSSVCYWVCLFRRISFSRDNLGFGADYRNFNFPVTKHNVS